MKGSRGVFKRSHLDNVLTVIYCICRSWMICMAETVAFEYDNMYKTLPPVCRQTPGSGKPVLQLRWKQVQGRA
jgi:hypothetical protein